MLRPNHGRTVRSTSHGTVTVVAALGVGELEVGLQLRRRAVH